MTPTEFKHVRHDVLGLTQQSLAASLRTTRVTIARYESGTRRIPGVVEVALKQLAGSPQLRLAGTVAAGEPIEPIAEHDVIDVPASMAGLGDRFALRIKGDSMRDEGILPGDVVIVRRQSTARNGETVLALLNQEATIKKYYRTTTGAELRPANADVATIVVDQVDDLQIQGVVVGVIRHL